MIRRLWSLLWAWLREDPANAGFVLLLTALALVPPLSCSISRKSDLPEIFETDASAPVSEDCSQRKIRTADYDAVRAFEPRTLGNGEPETFQNLSGRIWDTEGNPVVDLSGYVSQPVAVLIKALPAEEVIYDGEPVQSFGGYRIDVVDGERPFIATDSGEGCSLNRVSLPESEVLIDFHEDYTSVGGEGVSLTAARYSSDIVEELEAEKLPLHSESYAFVEDVLTSRGRTAFLADVDDFLEAYNETMSRLEHRTVLSDGVLGTAVIIISLLFALFVALAFATVVKVSNDFATQNTAYDKQRAELLLRRLPNSSFLAAGWRSGVYGRLHQILGWSWLEKLQHGVLKKACATQSEVTENLQDSEGRGLLLEYAGLLLFHTVALLKVDDQAGEWRRFRREDVQEVSVRDTVVLSQIIWPSVAVLGPPFVAVLLLGNAEWGWPIIFLFLLAMSVGGVKVRQVTLLLASGSIFVITLPVEVGDRFVWWLSEQWAGDESVHHPCMYQTEDGAYFASAPTPRQEHVELVEAEVIDEAGEPKVADSGDEVVDGEIVEPISQSPTNLVNAEPRALAAKKPEGGDSSDKERESDPETHLRGKAVDARNSPFFSVPKPSFTRSGWKDSKTSAPSTTKNEATHYLRIVKKDDES